MANSIYVEKLSKQYRIGELHRETMLRERLVNLIKHPLLRKKKETIWALKDVSFSVKEGEVIGIIGRNGAGKSTLLKVLSKITYPTSGKMRINGRVASLLEVGTGFHEELTGRENIYLNGSILGMTKKEINARLDQIFKFADIDKFIDTPIKRYSSGMRLRLGFAVAAHLKSDVLLVDEILAVGDAEFQKKCLRSMSDIGTSGRTVLFVSHNMSAVENLCSRVIWIDKGKVYQDGNARNVVTAYLSTFVESCGFGYDLRDIETRTGSGEIRYTKVEFLNSESQSPQLYRSGEGLTARLHYHAKKPISKPHFGLELYSDLGTKITSINTWCDGFDTLSLSPGDGVIEAQVAALNLMPGRYYVSLWLGKVGAIFDRIDHCASLDIESSDYVRSGRGFDSRQYGIVFFPSKWRFTDSNLEGQAYFS